MVTFSNGMNVPELTRSLKKIVIQNVDYIETIMSRKLGPKDRMTNFFKVIRLKS